MSAPSEALAATTRGRRMLVRGRILDPVGERADEAMLVEDGRVRALGSFDELLRLAGEGIEVLDRRDAGDIVPGFVDAHTHLGSASRVLGLNVSVHTPPVSSIAEMLVVLRRAEPGLPEGEWLQAQGNLGQSYRLEDRRYPTRHDLDAVSATRPIIVRFGAHVWVFNTAGLARLGIDRDTRLPEPVYIEHDAAGEPTGLINDIVFAADAVPGELPPTSADDFRRAIVATTERYFTARGVTTIGEIPDDVMEIRVMREEQDAGRLPLRIALYTLGAQATALLDDWPRSASWFADDPERWFVRGFKLAADGGISAREAAVWNDYVDRPGYRGQLGLTPQQIGDIVDRAEQLGLQVMVHTAGDRAMDMVLDAFEAARPDDGVWRSRHRIEHLGNMFSTDERLRRCRDLGITPVANIGFLHGIGDSMRGVVGDDFASSPMYRLRAMLELGLPTVGASDFAGGLPEISDPVHLMRVMRERRTFSGVEVGPDQALTPWEALRAVTAHAAWSLQLEDEVGSLAPGHWADFAVLSGDLVGADADRLGGDGVHVVETWLAGESVWRA
ncbi:amidohydrolase [Herbiconiux sp. A18JL235]|uniref:Amidohydrolase n=1 Tax=Herbiconiux sp. A18JL235 TaxID=3152363 RepID=A0AB39BFV5_9MICO